MALINCPKCGKQISDKAKICPNCKFDMDERMTTCPECKLQVRKDAELCPNCGYPISEENDIKAVVPVDNIDAAEDSGSISSESVSEANDIKAVELISNAAAVEESENIPLENISKKNGTNYNSSNMNSENIRGQKKTLPIKVLIIGIIVVVLLALLILFFNSSTGKINPTKEIELNGLKVYAPENEEWSDWFDKDNKYKLNIVEDYKESEDEYHDTDKTFKVSVDVKYICDTNDFESYAENTSFNELEFDMDYDEDERVSLGNPIDIAGCAAANYQDDTRSNGNLEKIICVYCDTSVFFISLDWDPNYYEEEEVMELVNACDFEAYKSAAVICAKEGCHEFTPHGREFCLKHGCAEEWCENMPVGSSSYCLEHSEYYDSDVPDFEFIFDAEPDNDAEYLLEKLAESEGLDAQVYAYYLDTNDIEKVDQYQDLLEENGFTTDKSGKISKKGTFTFKSAEECAIISFDTTTKPDKGAYLLSIMILKK